MKTCLNDSLGANDLQNLPAPLGPIRQGKVHNLCITWKLEEHDKDRDEDKDQYHSNVLIWCSKNIYFYYQGTTLCIKEQHLFEINFF